MMLNLIDYRSDTVTKPTPAMLEAMMTAQVGDDVFGEDPSVNALEKLAANMFGMEAALFCTSGTQTNQIAIKCHTQPGQEVICDADAHVYQYEGGGIASNSLCSVKLLPGDRGRINATQVLEAINNPQDVHKAVTSLVCVENTSNRGGGSCYDFTELEKIRKVCDAHGLAFHIDGARLFNALVAKGETTLQYGALFDSISVCLSKSLGCPVGSLLIGKKDFIQKARRVRKAWGGGMRQAGFLAAAGVYALQNNINRLDEDHAHAKAIASALAGKPFVKQILPVETNIIIFETAGLSATALTEKFAEHGIRTYAMTPQRVRLVMHLGITPDMVDQTIDVIHHKIH
ncbi:MAG: GntG family PLP-dependent aldolase [Niabella sp.]